MSEIVEKAEEVAKTAADTEDADDGEGGDVNPEEESTATFTPIVQLQEVEVKTYEEDEDCLMKKRAKLYVFGETMLNKGTGNKSWNDKGVGEVKFLKHKESSRIRLLMRQEKTMKVIANHLLDPRITIVANSGASDRSWVWTAFDFSDSVLVETTFAIKFANAEEAQEFQKQFKESQDEMKKVLAGEDSTEGKKEADEAAEAIASLGVSDKKEDATPTEST
mmetsp:Transcript_11688/g.11731  ORF Transcript_11688/g.11731 Transcript_11688/m.11731 type:complete len:221 (+) Transcript_11688:58-720(+)|eukprot:CAMPEP_0182428128 /NCGR_PEP_ID=MMETSP1167-20130531/21044_1 /TAXON_ID=2988 /ORGANISM="Mallomonas Sp, Strain CCMP3275" /LENGTH=220 /DNA_ID=CAMNT_0024610821 /DNA_START=41 /DNA_END=703 /DNA_ORIENTATION=+